MRSLGDLRIRALGLIRHQLLARAKAVEARGLGRVDGFPTLRAARGGKLYLAERVRLFPNVRIELKSSEARISIGAKTFINRDSELICCDELSIGSDCAISWAVIVTDTDVHSVDGRPNAAPVRIGNRVWIGQGAKILKGVTIGDGAVVATGSIVTRDVPAGTLVAGVPARVVREGVTWEL